MARETPAPVRELYSKAHESVEVTVVLANGDQVRFSCMGGPMPKRGGSWRIDSAYALDPIPEYCRRSNDDRNAIYDALEEALAVELGCTEVRVQADRVVLV